MNNNSLSSSKVITHDYKDSVWSYFNPNIPKVRSRIEDWFLTNKDTRNTLVLLSLENMVPILLTGGESLTMKIIDNVHVAIKSAISTNSLIIPHGLDGFILIFEHLKKEELKVLIKELSKSIQRSNNEHSQITAYLNIKVGATFFDRNVNVNNILDQGFIALYESRQDSENILCIFDNVLNKVVEYQNQMQMAAYFQNILLTKRYQLAFQPVVIAKTGVVKSYESLFRILTDDNQIISAGPFICIAEMFGFVADVDIAVLHLVHQELVKDKDLLLALNVSPQTVFDGNWLKIAQTLLEDPTLASRMIIEITETAMHKNMPKIISFVEAVQSFGCQIAIDDFGAGYTSFTQLKLLNADILKIDGIFIRDLVDNPDNQLFVKTLIEFSKAFNLKTVAEYVETAESAKILTHLGVDYLQGHYFSKALNHRPWTTK